MKCNICESEILIEAYIYASGEIASEFESGRCSDSECINADHDEKLHRITDDW